MTPNLREILVAELKRRESMKQAILRGFEVTKSKRDAVRASDVAELVLQQIRTWDPLRRLGWPIYREVTRSLLAMGCWPWRPHNRSYWRGIRARVQTGQSQEHASEDRPGEGQDEVPGAR